MFYSTLTVILTGSAAKADGPPLASSASNVNSNFKDFTKKEGATELLTASP